MAEVLKAYQLRLERFLESFPEEFGYPLEDPFDDMVEMLAERRAFSFARFGDGEFFAVLGESGENCDGHGYHPELGRRLGEILAAKPAYLTGLQPLAVMRHGVEPIRTRSHGIRWVYSDSLHSALLDGRLDRFFDALKRLPVVLVGPPHLHSFAVEKAWLFAEVAYGDCWPQYEALKRLLAPWARVDGVIFLFCASMTSNVLIDDLHKANPRNTYIDVGSVFDPFVGIASRVYHDAIRDALPMVEEVNPATGARR